MDWLQNLLNNSSTPVLTAFLLGLLTAISPCPLATNIAAVGFIGRNIENRKRVFINGLLYTLGRVLSYTLLAFIYSARSSADNDSQRRFQHVRHTEDYRYMG